MKKRMGFVSNSSSSSFIVISDEDLRLPLNTHFNTDDEDKLIIGFEGEIEFGWGIADYFDFHTKLNWCYLQASYSIDFEHYKEMLENVLKEDLKISGLSYSIIDEKIKDYSAYIDHQSCCYETPENMDMFLSETDLRNFLYSTKSKIHVDNDNH